VKNAIVFVLLVLLFCSQIIGEGKIYPYRWVYVSNSLQNDEQLNIVKKIIERASSHGLNGMVFASGLDMLDLKKDDYFKYLNEVKIICDQNKIEIIPIIFSVGYGGAILSHDKNLAEGILVKDALFVVKDNEAIFVSDSPSKIINGGFEEYKGDKVEGYRLQEEPGIVSLIDNKEFHEGKVSLRFERFGSRNPYGHGRIMQEVDVKPNRCYRVSCWVKTDGLFPAESFRIQILTKNGKTLAPWNPKIKSTSNWTKITLGFNSLNNETIRIYAGVWGGKWGRFWLDDLRIEEVGLVNVLRRPGTPVVVRSEKDNTIYEEEKDYGFISDAKLNFRFDHDVSGIKILPGSRISNGERLRVSYYHGMAINNGQVTICMSEPAVYEIWEKEAELIHKYLSPNKYVLSMDEIRTGGTCKACKERKMSMAEILGDCITKQFNIIRKVNPKAEIFIWSDMLDPNHNAHLDYYLVDGDFSGSWNYIPKELNIICWYYDKRNESLRHFSNLGFKTVAAAYYDGDDLENPKGWLEALDKTKGACGIMYTTWFEKYSLLEDFGDLVSKRE
jgi:hypothetical protein